MQYFLQKIPIVNITKFFHNILCFISIKDKCLSRDVKLYQNQNGEFGCLSVLIVTGIKIVLLNRFEIMDFFFVKVSPLSHGKLSELDFANCDSGESENTDIVTFAHAAYLAVSALVQFKAGNRIATAFADLRDLYGKSDLAVDVY